MSYTIPLIKEYTRSPIGRGKDRGESHVINEGRPSQLDDCLHDDDDMMISMDLILGGNLEIDP